MRTLALVCVLAACSGGKRPAPDHAHHGSGDHHGHHGHHMGSGSASVATATDPQRGAHLKIACSAEAQKEFDRGFFFLHNMDYVSARRTFETAAGAHASCAMLHWGTAMTYFQPLWPGQPTKESLQKGAAAVEKARAASANASAIERDLIAAVGGFYDGWEKSDSATRFKQWEAGQRRAAEAHPNDIEAQAFWMLSRLANADRKDKTYKEPLAVAAKLEEMLAKRPDHPGLLHYLLHAYDNPMYAKQAVGIAKTYEVVSPDAAHALHMPSHIHVRLGNWQEVIDWNIKSAAAALKHPVEGRISRDWLHALDYMTYGYLQLGDDAKAKAGVDQIDPATKYELNSGPGAYGLAATPARYALERKAWKEAAALVVKRVEYSWDLYPWAEAVTHAARGLGAARLRNVKDATAAIAELERLLPKVESPWWKGRIEIERDVIAAWIAFAKRDAKRAESLMRGAAQRELASGKDNVEPGHVITAAEELGDLLLELKKPADALSAFKAALVESPRRFNALHGGGRAAELAGDAAEARRLYQELVDISASSTRPARAHAQAYLASKR